MTKDLRRYPLHYTTLALILIIHTVLLFIFYFNKPISDLILLSSAVWYVGWGLVHHYLTKDLTKEIVFEYLALGILVYAIGLSILG